MGAVTGRHRRGRCRRRTEIRGRRRDDLDALQASQQSAQAPRSLTEAMSLALPPPWEAIAGVRRRVLQHGRFGNPGRICGWRRRLSARTKELPVFPEALAAAWLLPCERTRTDLEGVKERVAVGNSSAGAGHPVDGPSRFLISRRWLGGDLPLMQRLRAPAWQLSSPPVQRIPQRFSEALVKPA
eukprot:scaffold7375_cov268-Pinguiococcus_pyrenoidosus.AAC.26